MPGSSSYTDSIRSQTTRTDISSKSDAEARYYQKERQAERRRRKAESTEHVAPPPSRYATGCTADQHNEGTEPQRASIDGSGKALLATIPQLQNGETQRYVKVQSTPDQIHDGSKEHILEIPRPLQALAHPSTTHTEAPEPIASSKLETNNPTQQAHAHAQPPITTPNKDVTVHATNSHNQAAEDPKVSASVQDVPPELAHNKAITTQARSVPVGHEREKKSSPRGHLTAIGRDSFYKTLDLALGSFVMALRFYWFPIRYLVVNKYVLGLIIASFAAYLLIPSNAATLFYSGLGVAANLCLPARQVHQQICVAPGKSINYFRGLPRADILDEPHNASTSHLRFLENNFAHLHRSVKDIPTADRPESQGIVLAETYTNTYSQAIRSAESLEAELRRQQLSLYYTVDGYIGRFPSKTVEKSFFDRVFGWANSALRSEARRATEELLATLETSWSVYNTADETFPTDTSDGPLYHLFRIDIHKLCEQLQSNMNRVASYAERVAAANARTWTINSDVIMKQMRNKAYVIKRDLQWLDLQMQILERNRQTLKNGQGTLGALDWEGLLNDIMLDTIRMAFEWRGKVKAVLAAE